MLLLLTGTAEFARKKWLCTFFATDMLMQQYFHPISLSCLNEQPKLLLSIQI